MDEALTRGEQTGIIPSSKEVRRILREAIGRPDALEWRIGVAYAVSSGLRCLDPELNRAKERGLRLSGIIGIGEGITSKEFLEEVADWPAKGDFGLWARYVPGQKFHLKVYQVNGRNWGQRIIGSANLSRGGLLRNVEAAHASGWGTEERDEEEVRWERMFRELCAEGKVREVTAENIEIWRQAGLIASEAERNGGGPRGGKKKGTGGFGSVGEGEIEGFEIDGFVMTIGHQESRGTSAAGGEVWIPLTAMRKARRFWGWNMPLEKTRNDDPKRTIEVIIDEEVHEATLWEYRARKEFRMRCGAIAGRGEVGDVLELEKEGTAKYKARIVGQDSSEFQGLKGLCTEVPGSRNTDKRYGYYTIEEGNEDE